MNQQAAEAELKDKRAFEEQRLAVRVPVDFQATFSIAGRPVQTGRITEISRSGLRLLSGQEMPPGTLVKIAFQPVITRADDARVRVGGRVARLVRKVGAAWEYGIEVVGDREMKSALQRTVLQMSLLTFDSCLAEHGTLKASGTESKRPGAKGTDSRGFDERRRFMRAPVDFEASYTAGGMPPQPARVTEISKTGLRLRSGERFAIGTFVEVTFEPTFAEVASAKRRVCVRGRVARLVRPEGPPFEFGIEVLSDLETKCTLQWAVLQVGLKAASKRNEGTERAPRWY